MNGNVKFGQGQIEHCQSSKITGSCLSELYKHYQISPNGSTTNTCSAHETAPNSVERQGPGPLVIDYYKKSAHGYCSFKGH